MKHRFAYTYRSADGKRGFAVHKTENGWLASSNHFGGPGRGHVVPFQPEAGSVVECSQLDRKAKAWVSKPELNVYF